MMQDFPDEIETYRTLYNIDSTGRMRIWYAQQDGSAYRVVAGLENGKLVESGWKYAKGKNVGKSNETTNERQAELEIERLYTKQLESGYSETRENAGDSVAFFEPMLAYKWADALKKKKVQCPLIVQPKLDGIRCIARADGLWSRNGKPIVSAPHISIALKHFFNEYPNAVLDGELYNHDLKADFNSIISLTRKTKPTEEDLVQSGKLIQYHIYDMPTIDGQLSMDYSRRYQRLMSIVHANALLTADFIRIVKTQHIDYAGKEEMEALLQSFLLEGYEGIMIRAPRAIYEQDRSWSLLKHKEFLDEEFEIVEVEEGIGNWAGYAKRVVCRLKDGRTFETGMRGNQTFAKQLLDEKYEYVGGTATVRYQNLTPDGIPRFGVTVAFYKRGEQRQ